MAGYTDCTNQLLDQGSQTQMNVDRIGENAPHLVHTFSFYKVYQLF